MGGGGLGFFVEMVTRTALAALEREQPLRQGSIMAGRG